MRFPGGSAFLELLSGDFSKKSQHTLNRGHRLAPRAWHVVTSKHEKADAKREKKKEKKQLTEWKQGEQHLSFVREKPLRCAIVWCTETHELWISAELLLNSLHQHQARELHHMTSNTHMRCDLCRAPNIRGSLLWSAASAGWIITLCCTWLHLESREDFDKLDVCWEVAEDAASQRGKINTNWWCSG